MSDPEAISMGMEVEGPMEVKELANSCKVENLKALLPN